MPRIVTVGSVALDSVKTPFGEVKEALGGSATFAGFSASFFADVGIVAVVGDDFPKEHLDLLNSRIDTAGITQQGKSFRWVGYYEGGMDSATTVSTELGSFADFNPVLPEAYQNAEYIFLANIDPVLQLHVLKQLKGPKLRVLDTMNYWIREEPRELVKAISLSDVFLLNDSEARMLFKTQDLEEAAQLGLALGPKAIVIKLGSRGSSLFTSQGRTDFPAVKLQKVVDPTGAGDTFAGGFIGYLAKSQDLSEESLKNAVCYGTVMASFNVQGFGLEGLKNATTEAIDERLRSL